MTIAIQDPVQYAVWVDLTQCDIRKDARFHPDEEIENLAKSMAVKQLQNIIVCRTGDPVSPAGGRYEVIVGVGRVLAARKLGWTKIRADVYEGLPEFQKLEMTFSENEDRENASPLYQAQLLKAMQGSGEEALTQEQLAERIGKSQQGISKYISLLALSPQIWANTNALVKLGLRHFIQLLRLENKDDQWKFAEMVAEKGLSSSELGALIDKQIGKTQSKGAGRPKGNKNFGAAGHAFVQKGSKLRIKVICDLTEDLDTFLRDLKAAILTWRESHPLKPRGLPAGRQGPPAGSGT
jgi:ParB/RepB/Spo0J family partition protein